MTLSKSSYTGDGTDFCPSFDLVTQGSADIGLDQIFQSNLAFRITGGIQMLTVHKDFGISSRDRWPARDNANAFIELLDDFGQGFEPAIGHIV
jgi:hypothetical protein